MKQNNHFPDIRQPSFPRVLRAEVGEIIWVIILGLRLPLMCQSIMISYSLIVFFSLLPKQSVIGGIEQLIPLNGAQNVNLGLTVAR